MVLKTVMHRVQTAIGFLILARIRAIVVLMLVVLPGKSVLGDVGVKSAANAEVDSIFLPCVLNGLVSKNLSGGDTCFSVIPALL